MDDSGVLCGPTARSHGPGTDPFDRLVKSVGTSATRVGEASRYGYFFWRGIPDEVAAASEKIEQAHKLLCAAHALLRTANQ